MKIYDVQAQDERIRRGWESRRGEPLVIAPVRPTYLWGCGPDIAQDFSNSLISFAARVFHNEEKELYAQASEAIKLNSRFYLEHKDIRDDRDSFYWQIGVLCRTVWHYGSEGDIAPGRIDPEAEDWFYTLMWSYCYDRSNLTLAEYKKCQTWFIHESGNHHMQFISALWMFIKMLLRRGGYEGRKFSDGNTIEFHRDAWRSYIVEYLSQRGRKGLFVETASNVYGPEVMKCIIQFYDFADDDVMKRLAKNVMDLQWLQWAQEEIGGTHGGGQSRVYPQSAVEGRSGLTSWAWYYVGMRDMKRPWGEDYLVLDSAYRMDELTARMILEPEKRGIYEVWERPLGLTLPESVNNLPYKVRPDWGDLLRYGFCTPEFTMGTLTCHQRPDGDWALISSQNRFQGVRFARDDASVLPIPQALDGGGAQSYNQFWSMQKEGTLITQKCRYAGDSVGMMRTWLSEGGGLSDFVEKGGWIFSKTQGAYIALRVTRGGYQVRRETFHGMGGAWVINLDEYAPVILETVRSAEYASFEDFCEEAMKHAPVWDRDTLTYRSLYNHQFVMYTRGAASDESTIDGECYMKKLPFSFYSPFLRGYWDENTVTASFDGMEKRMDFSTDL